MRRFFVICLILLLPLNMFGLAMAASAMQPALASEHATSQNSPAQPATADAVAEAISATYLSATFDCDFGCDIDPDEPPAGADIHDSVNEEVGLRLALMAGRVLPPGASLRPSHSSVPLLKPPRAL